jgi:hypothetical protein
MCTQQIPVTWRPALLPVERAIENVRLEARRALAGAGSADELADAWGRRAESCEGLAQQYAPPGRAEPREVDLDMAAYFNAAADEWADLALQARSGLH